MFMHQKSYLLKQGAAVLLLLAFAGCSGSGSGASTTPSAAAPGIMASTPSDGTRDFPRNGSFKVQFDKPMDGASLTANSFTLTSGAEAVPVKGLVTYTNSTAAFWPATPLPRDSKLTATITTEAKSASGVALPTNHSWILSTGGGNSPAPTVLSNTPLNGAVGVSLNPSITATFSQAMEPGTLTTSTFTLTSLAGLGTVPGTVTYANSVAVLTPAGPLMSNTTYTATVTTGTYSAFGFALASDYVWTFTTGAGAASTPTVVSTTPFNGALGVPLNGSISATFSAAMDPTTLTGSTFTLTVGAAAVPVPGTVSYSNSTAVFLPTSPLVANSTYTATITTGAKSALGVALATSYPWSFTTIGGNSTTPTVLSNIPLNGALGVPLNGSISATFNVAMDPTTLNTSTFTLALVSGFGNVAGIVTYANSTAVFLPSSQLMSNSTYLATITTGAKSTSGIALAANYAWTFTTGNTKAPGLPVNLGAAGNFVILSKAGISTVPASAITGDIGVSPIKATGLTGFTLTADPSNVFATSTQVAGKVYASDYAPPTPTNLTTAVLDMQLAFTNAAGRAPDVTELGAGNIGGLTIAPGVYRWGTGLLIPTNITLTGSATDVWIFQVAQNLTLSPTVKVLLAGGAVPKNIFWQVAGSVEFGTTAHGEGVVLCQTAIALRTGASINGRLLAQTAVTLDSSTVVQPAP